MSKAVNFRFPEELIEKIAQEHEKFVATTGVKISRAAFMRMAIENGIEQLKEKFNIQ